jgi:hypothetical protein
MTSYFVTYFVIRLNHMVQTVHPLLILYAV